MGYFFRRWTCTFIWNPLLFVDKSQFLPKLFIHVLNVLDHFIFMSCSTLLSFGMGFGDLRFYLVFKLFFYNRRRMWNPFVLVLHQSFEFIIITLLQSADILLFFLHSTHFLIQFLQFIWERILFFAFAFLLCAMLFVHSLNHLDSVLILVDSLQTGFLELYFFDLQSFWRVIKQIWVVAIVRTH